MSVIDTGIYAYFSSSGTVSTNPLLALCRGYLVFGNIPDLTTYNTSVGGTNINFADADGSWMVMPGCKLELYANSTYSGTKTTLDNTNGNTVRLFYAGAPVNTTSSIKVFYKGVPGPDVSSISTQYIIGNTYVV